MKKNSNDISQATSFLSSACIWNIIGHVPALSSPPCCFSLSLCFPPSLWSGFYSWLIFLHSSALDILALTLSMLFPFPFILLFSSLSPSFHPPLSISLTHSFSLFFTLSCSLSLHLLFFDLLGPSVLSLTALHRLLGWKKEKRVQNYYKALSRGGEIHHHIHKREKKRANRKVNIFNFKKN